MDVAIVPGRTEFLNDRMFSYHDNVSSALDKWTALRDYVTERGGQCHTFDWYRSRNRRFDVALTDDVSPLHLFFLAGLRVNPRRVILSLVEPPVIRPLAWRLSRLYAPFVGKIVTPNTAVTRSSRRFAHLMLPQPFDPKDEQRWVPLRARARSRFAVMVRSNKVSNQPGELYSFRRRLIRYFEASHPEKLDLFGFGWNDQEVPDPFFTTLYRGIAPHQIDVFPDYRFVISIDNSRAHGLITYDIFNAMLVGSVPVYLGAPDVTDYIPGDCFVDLSAFKTFDALTDRLEEIARSGEWDEYRERAKHFLASEAVAPFSIRNFCESMYRVLAEVSDRRF